MPKFSGTGFVLENIATKESEFILLNFRVQGWVGNVATREFWHILHNFSDVGLDRKTLQSVSLGFILPNFLKGQ